MPRPIPSRTHAHAPSRPRSASTCRSARDLDAGSGLGWTGLASRHRISTTTFEALGAGGLQSGKRSTLLRGAANGAVVALAEANHAQLYVVLPSPASGGWWVGGHVCTTNSKEDVEMSRVLFLLTYAAKRVIVSAGGWHKIAWFGVNGSRFPVAGAGCGG